MPATSISLTEQMLRRRPVIGAPVAYGASEHLKRSIGTFELTMFGVGSTIEFTFRRLFTSGHVHNYFWKARLDGRRDG